MINRLVYEFDPFKLCYAFIVYCHYLNDDLLVMPLLLEMRVALTT